MKLFPLVALATFTAAPVFAEETRHLGTHEHGVGQLDIAFDGQDIAMELHAPGADIVGFEYAATSADDLAKLETALATLAQPLNLFEMPAEAGCSVVAAAAELESEDAHDDHDEHDDHGAHEDHDDDHHDDHADNDAHDHDEHDEHGHDDKDAHDHDADHKDEHEDHDDHAHHDEHDHDEAHEGHAGHTEFHAEYALTCTDPSAVTEINFTYFAAFPNALEVEVQLISDAGATAFEVERDAPTLDLKGKL